MKRKCQIQPFAYSSIKTDCIKDLLGEKKGLFMEESVIPRRAIEQSEMTKPFLIPYDGSVFFLSK